MQAILSTRALGASQSGKSQPYKDMQATLSTRALGASSTRALGASESAKWTPAREADYQSARNAVPNGIAAPAIHAAPDSIRPRTPFSDSIARLENAHASAPHSRSSIPRPGLKSGWNMEDSPAALREMAADCSSDLTAASQARIARLQTLALGSQAQALVATVNPPPARDEKIVKLRFSFKPPQFKVCKKGPRAGQTVEVQGMMKFASRVLTDAARVSYSFTSRSTAVKVSTGAKLTPAEWHATATRRWPAAAAELAAWLLCADFDPKAADPADASE